MRRIGVSSSPYVAATARQVWVGIGRLFGVERRHERRYGRTMDAHNADDNQAAWKAWNRREGGVWVLAFLALLVVSFTLQDAAGIPFDTTYRIACAALCLFFIYRLGLDYPGEQWPRISLGIALLINAAIFFTPLVNRPTSRGELMLFALPDAVVVLTARIASYHVTDVHQRAARQTMILGLIVALVFCIGLFAVTLVGVHSAPAPSGSH